MSHGYTIYKGNFEALLENSEENLKEHKTISSSW